LCLKAILAQAPTAPAEDIIGTLQLILKLFIVKQILKQIEHKNAQSVVNGYQNLSQK
jgi:hypothetical protein